MVLANSERVELIVRGSAAGAASTMLQTLPYDRFSPHPDIVSESGRAIVAHHSVLIVEVFGSIAKTSHEQQFTYTENIGISLGLLNATNPVGRWMLVALTSAIAVAVAIWIVREKNRVDQLALGMVLGGALGNILDRVRHGYVTDFLDLHFGDIRPFLVFNVGDAAISIGVVILLLRAFLTRKERPEETIEHA